MPSKTKDKTEDTAADAEDQDADTDAQPRDDEGDFVTIPFRGMTFVIPRNRDDWSTEGLAYLSEGKFNLFAKYILEVAQPGQWKLVTKLCPRRKDFREFFAAFSKATEDCIG